MRSSACGRKSSPTFSTTHHGDGIVSVCVKTSLGENLDFVQHDPARFYMPRTRQTARASVFGATARVARLHELRDLAPGDALSCRRGCPPSPAGRCTPDQSGISASTSCASSVSDSCHPRYLRPGIISGMPSCTTVSGRAEAAPYVGQPARRNARKRRAWL